MLLLLFARSCGLGSWKASPSLFIPATHPEAAPHAASPALSLQKPTYLTVPAHKLDSPTMSRARIGSGRVVLSCWGSAAVGVTLSTWVLRHSEAGLSHVPSASSLTRIAQSSPHLVPAAVTLSLQPYFPALPLPDRSQSLLGERSRISHHPDLPLSSWLLHHTFTLPALSLFCPVCPSLCFWGQLGGEEAERNPLGVTRHCAAWVLAETVFNHQRAASPRANPAVLGCLSK